MFCQYQYYREWTEDLQTALDHSNKSYQCKEMSDCPYIGTTLINKLPWDDGKIEKPEENETFSEAENKREDGETEMVEEIRPTRACAGEAGDTQEEQQPRSPTAVSVQERILNFEKMLSSK